MAKMPTTDEWVEKIGNKAINEFVYEGRTLKEWIDLMASGKLVVTPDNATNGDVIRLIFPFAKARWITQSRIGITITKNQDYIIEFDLKWWDAKYKAGDTDA